MNKLWQRYDDEGLRESDIENDYRNLAIFQKHNQTLCLQHLAKKYDFWEL
ncbi:MAG: hypothetical protein BWY04_01407 [candidate division CPR1 bacterium ADurb.Bin160]|jgi:hypothetical protein|uniref:Uncharacterized protein n=1 Tax=candidate division CPR1 bacterium ADurb.Bin160 TaxID=1852826 RepID=A0A1V5ZJW6_9BACT|nr:MAG: hypothetical protein BWY04_01407 [candidate division CPR1 bacterium ADurb.Bin160]